MTKKELVKCCIKRYNTYIKTVFKTELIEMQTTGCFTITELQCYHKQREDTLKNMEVNSES